MKKFVLYTARFGSPGRFNFPEISIPGVDKICFTDLDIEDDLVIPIRNGGYIKNGFYKIVKMKLDYRSSVMNQRRVKICIPDEIFDNYEYSVYVDCKRPAQVDFEKALSCLEQGSDFLTRKHPKRECAYDEGKVCVEKKKDSEETIMRQLRFYQKAGFPYYNGLYWTVKLFRRHTRKLKFFSELWWGQLLRFSHRDQISLPYVAWKHNMKISVYPERK